MRFRIKHFLVLVGGVGLLLVAWLAWPNGSPDGTKPPANDGAGQGGVGDGAATAARSPVHAESPQANKGRPKMRLSIGQAAPGAVAPGAGAVAPGEFRVLSNTAVRDPRDLEAIKAVNDRWERFVRSARPTEAQQQVILSAIYDAQLYYVEVRRVEREWAREWAVRGDETESGPQPESSWTWMDEVEQSVNDRAAEVLDEQQYQRFLHQMGGAPVVVAVPVKWVEPANPPRL